MRLTAIIPTTERRARLEEGVNAALEDPAVHEVIVAVNSADPGRFDEVSEFARRDDRVRALEIAARGKSRAEQVALEVATGDVVLFLDDDVVPAPDLASGHLEHHCHRSDLVLVGYMPLPALADEPGLGAARIYHEDYEQTCRSWEADPHAMLTNLWGGNLSLRRETALRVGIHSPAFGPLLRHVDRDFGLRCMDAGLTGVFDRRLRATHWYSRSLDQFVADARWQALGRARIHELHADVVGPLEPDAYRSDLPFPRAAVVGVGTSLVGHPFMLAALRMAIALAGRRRQWAREAHLARLARRVELSYHSARRASGDVGGA